MNRELVEKVVNAVLYEGYILYPYRASSKKNQRERFTFGRIYPEAYSVAQEGREPASMQTECLLRDESKDALVEISVRFLHPMARTIEGQGIWHEVVEQTIALPQLSLGKITGFTQEFHFAESRQSDGVAVRTQDAISGVVEVAVVAIDAAVSKLTVRVRNQTPVAPDELQNQNAIVMRTMASAHIIIQVTGGSCLSLLDPPPQYAAAAKDCQNIGCWPVLVGDEEKHENDTMLASPIILYDYPKIAAESAGDLFDGLEIDEILTLRVMAMSDDEKVEMRQVDEQARRILERTENLPSEHLLKMHGAMRNLRPVAEDFFNPKTKLETATVGGKQVKAGDRVRIRPKKRADVMDMALDGKVAVIEAVEQDVEGGVQLALVIEDDPGIDLGMMRQPGHRFFYGVDEVEPI